MGGRKGWRYGRALRLNPRYNTKVRCDTMLAVLCGMREYSNAGVGERSVMTHVHFVSPAIRLQWAIANTKASTTTTPQIPAPQEAVSSSKNEKWAAKLLALLAIGNANPFALRRRHRHIYFFASKIGPSCTDF